MGRGGCVGIAGAVLVCRVGTEGSVGMAEAVIGLAMASRGANKTAT